MSFEDVFWSFSVDSSLLELCWVWSFEFEFKFSSTWALFVSLLEVPVDSVKILSTTESFRLSKR